MTKYCISMQIYVNNSVQGFLKVNSVPSKCKYCLNKGTVTYNLIQDLRFSLDVFCCWIQGFSICTIRMLLILCFILRWHRFCKTQYVPTLFNFIFLFACWPNIRYQGIFCEKASQDTYLMQIDASLISSGMLRSLNLKHFLPSYFLS